MSANEAILTAHCDDRAGIVAKVSNWVFEKGGNILGLDQHVDSFSKRFFIRVHWSLENFKLKKNDIAIQFEKEMASEFNFDYSISFVEDVPKLAIFVSKLGHCIWDILARHESGELKAEIPLIISNHEKYRSLADRFNIPFHLFEINKTNKAEQEKKELELLKAHDIDLVVLARYMQVLSEDFVSHYPNRIINIHHSFLPAFAGAKPYHRAHERGVKLVGATAHYVTSDLDEGPIIEQDTIRVSHKESVEELVRRGCDLEKIILSRAIHLHLDERIAVHGNRTMIFE